MKNNIRKLRLQHSMTQNEFGAIAGVSDKAVSTWEQGLKNPRKGVINKLAQHFNVSPAWIEGYTDDPTNYNDPELISRIPQSILTAFGGDVQKAYWAWQQKVTGELTINETVLSIVNSLDEDILQQYGNDLSVAVAEQKKRDEEQSRRDAHILLHTKPIKENPFEPQIDIVKNFEKVSKKIYQVPVFESVSAGFSALAENEIVDYIPVVIDNPYDVPCTIAIKVTGDSMYPKIEDGDIIIVRKQDSVDSGDIAVLLLDDDEGLVKRVVYGDTWIELHSINPEYKTRRFDEADVLRLRVVGKVIGSYKAF